MAGSSNTNMSTWTLVGIVDSGWGDDLNVTIDDKLHMTETSNVQTVQGPMNFSNTSVTTFAGPFNNTNTNVSTFSGPILANGGTVALWDADNTEVTRYYTKTCPDMTDGTLDGMANVHAGLAPTDSAIYNLDLPHGCTVMELFVTARLGGGIADFNAGIVETEYGSSTAPYVSGNMTESNIGTAEIEYDMNISSTFVVDNANNGYHVHVWNRITDSQSFDVMGIRVQYTIKRPYP